MNVYDELEKELTHFDITKLRIYTIYTYLYM